MAVIAHDSPAQQETGSADITVDAKELPALDEGFSIDKSKKVPPSCSADRNSGKEPLPTEEITAEPSVDLPVENKVKKRRKRKRKSRKIRARVVIKGPRPKSGIFSGKFRMKLPKKAIGNRIFFIALCAFFQYQLAHSVLNCTLDVPVPERPLVLNDGHKNFIFHQPTFCPVNVPVFRSCTACYLNTSRLRIVCSHAGAKDILVKPLKGNGDGAIIRMTSEDCYSFVKKSHGHRIKRSQLSPGFDLKESEKSVEETHNNMAPDGNDYEICTKTIEVTDPPIVIKQDDDSYNFREATKCPERVAAFKSCSACFKSPTLLEISCRKKGDENYAILWVEHGKGRGSHDLVEMNPKVCHKVVKNKGIGQGDRYDGGISRRQAEGNKGTSLQYSGILVIPVFYILVLIFGNTVHV